MDRTQKWMGSVGCLGQIENIKRQSLYKKRKIYARFQSKQHRHGFTRFLVDYQIKNYLYENFRKDCTKNFNTKNFVIT